MKSSTLYLEGALYTIIALAIPFSGMLESHDPISPRMIVAVSVASLIAGCNALKAFLSTSFSRATGDAVLVRDDLLKPGDKLFGQSTTEQNSTKKLP
jgi:hypothetical protein